MNHGGQLQRAQIEYPQAPTPWLDLSTGIAPWSWPVPDIPADIWQRLPEHSEALLQAARDYYGCRAWRVIPVAGSQLGIERIPHYLETGRVAIPLWGYAEHRKSWAYAGHTLCFYRDQEELESMIETGQVQHVLVINPNNPSTQLITVSDLRRWQSMLQSRGGTLVIDEAFMDSLPKQHSFVFSEADTNIDSPAQNVVVLRSVGKFFGMAGLRLGFILCSPSFAQKLLPDLPLWGVSHPAQWLGERMLRDGVWQQQQRQRIQHCREQLPQLLLECLPQHYAKKIQVGPLFCTVFGAKAELLSIYRALARQGILIRFFEEQQGQSGLRFGFGDDSGLERLRRTLMQKSDLVF